MCSCLSSQGTSRSKPFGDVLTPEQDVWSTNQFSLEFWFWREIGRSPLLVADCANANFVYVPLSLLWLPCTIFPEFGHKFGNFTAAIETHLPLVTQKPHFMPLSRVSFWSGIYIEQFINLGFTLLTIEGASRPGIIEVPYPGYYHHHAGLPYNRFIRRALQSKKKLAYECFATVHHAGAALELRQALHSACLSAPGQCQHVEPDYTGENLNREALNLLQNSSSAWFCIQPTGHSITRRSLFDCILAGSIPLVFDNQSLQHFPWRDVVDPLQMMLLLPEADIPKMYTAILPEVSLQLRQKLLNKIADVAHVYQYSLTPQSGLISWDNVGRIDIWDDAFTFAIKSFIRLLPKLKKNRLQTI